MAVPCANELTDGGHQLRALAQVRRHEGGLLKLLATNVATPAGGSSSSRACSLLGIAEEMSEAEQAQSSTARARALAAGVLGLYVGARVCVRKRPPAR